MNARLLRPTASGATHPEARDWATRVTANGGTVSSNTLAAVSKFCASINAASGLRAAILRLNLFCGNSDASLNAVRTPLYRGASLGGTQLGNAMDTNVNFVEGDYQETGSGGGLKGNGSTKYLNTGFNQNLLSSQTNTHLSFSGTSLETSGDRFAIGAYRFPGDAAGLPELLSLDVHTTGGRAFRSTGNSTVAVATPGASDSHFIGTRTSGSLSTVYRAGSSTATNTTTVTPSGVARAFFVFAGNNTSGTPEAFSAGRFRMYSIGDGLTAAQALAFSNAVIAFNTALGRA